MSHSTEIKVEIGLDSRRPADQSKTLVDDAALEYAA